MSTLLDSGNEVNIMHLAFAKKLGLVIQSINFSALIIDDTTFETYEIIVASF